jgi:hypothetical protein
LVFSDGEHWLKLAILIRNLETGFFVFLMYGASRPRRRKSGNTVALIQNMESLDEDKGSVSKFLLILFDVNNLTPT